jgi:hypothetical protein
MSDRTPERPDANPWRAVQQLLGGLESLVEIEAH